MNLADDYGETALTTSIQSGHDRCVQMLIEAGADVNMAHCFKKPWPLMCAVVSSSEEYVNVLIKAGADVNQIRQVMKIDLQQGYLRLLYAAITAWSTFSSRQEPM